ncbi:MAG: hypothetical protein JXL97_08480 [Bacteroidales bacterium]|nr:hypothetical protein [Bacteroidales bacterium]
MNKELTWDIFNDWKIDQTSQLNLNWESFVLLRPYYNELIKSRYEQLLTALNKWNTILVDYGKDPTYYDWDNFRPLRLNREEDWSDWLAFLIENSETGFFSKDLLKIKDDFSNNLSLPKVDREVTVQNFRADIIIKWQNNNFTHIEIKIGDKNLNKTFETSKVLQQKYKIDDKKWNNFILLLNSQLNDWLQVEDQSKINTIVKAITWKDVSISLRKSLLTNENHTWKAWAYTFIGAIEQKLINYKGFKITERPIDNLDIKTEILEKALNNGK